MSPNAALALDVVAEASPVNAAIAISSQLLGSVTVPATAMFTFPTGLFGFPECRRFALVPAARDGLFWLQSAEHSALTFLLVDPFSHFPSYSVELGAQDRLELGVQDASDIAMLCIVTLPRTRDERPTANLQGPLAINVRNGLGRQVATEQEQYGVRCAFSLEG